MQPKEKIIQYIDVHKEELYKLLSDLIKIDTQNYISHGNEQAGQDFLIEYSEKNGIQAQMYYPGDFAQALGYLPGRGTENRPNITGFLKGKSSNRSITLAAHMDTMPVGNEADWSVPPLGGVIKDGRIWGRGSSDNKSGVAASFFVAKALVDLGIPPENDVYITSYADEEYGGGNGALATCIKYPSDVYVNLDGGGMEVWPYGVGGCCCKAELYKNDTTSSTIDIFNGVSIVVRHLEDFGKRRFDELSKSPVFRETDIHKDAFRFLEITCGNGGLDLNRGFANFSYYTLSEYELIKEELDVITERVRKEVAPYGITFNGIEGISRFFKPINPKQPPKDAERFLNILSEMKKTPSRFAGGCLSDLSVFAEYGGGVAFNTGLFKGFGDYGGPHQIDEYVDCEELLILTKAIAVYLM